MEYITFKKFNENYNRAWMSETQYKHFYRAFEIATCGKLTRCTVQRFEDALKLEKRAYNYNNQVWKFGESETEYNCNSKHRKWQEAEFEKKYKKIVAELKNFGCAVSGGSFGSFYIVTPQRTIYF
jgi:hypothetical protein